MLEYQILKLTSPFTLIGVRFTRKGVSDRPKGKLVVNILLISEDESWFHYMTDRIRAS